MEAFQSLVAKDIFCCARTLGRSIVCGDEDAVSLIGVRICLTVSSVFIVFPCMMTSLLTVIPCSPHCVQDMAMDSVEFDDELVAIFLH